jgi:hypothetical protein
LAETATARFDPGGCSLRVGLSPRPCAPARESSWPRSCPRPPTIPRELPPPRRGRCRFSDASGGAGGRGRQARAEAQRRREERMRMCSQVEVSARAPDCWGGRGTATARFDPGGCSLRVGLSPRPCAPARESSWPRSCPRPPTIPRELPPPRRGWRRVSESAGNAPCLISRKKDIYVGL